MGELSAATRRALDDAAAGKGREPTTAHPLCTCTEEIAEKRLDGTVEVYRFVSKASRRLCPQHKPLR